MMRAADAEAEFFRMCREVPWPILMAPEAPTTYSWWDRVRLAWDVLWGRFIMGNQKTMLGALGEIDGRLVAFSRLLGRYGESARGGSRLGEVGWAIHRFRKMMVPAAREAIKTSGLSSEITGIQECKDS